MRQASSLVSGVPESLPPAWAIEEYSRRSGLVLEELEDEMDIRIYCAPRPVAGAPAAGAGGLITAPSQCSTSFPFCTRKVSNVNTSYQVPGGAVGSCRLFRWMIVTTSHSAVTISRGFPAGG